MRSGMIVLMMAAGLCFIGCSRPADRETERDAAENTPDAEARETISEEHRQAVECHIEALERWIDTTRQDLRLARADETQWVLDGEPSAPSVAKSVAAGKFPSRFLESDLLPEKQRDRLRERILKWPALPELGKLSLAEEIEYALEEELRRLTIAVQHEMHKGRRLPAPKLPPLGHAGGALIIGEPGPEDRPEKQPEENP